MRWLLCLSFPFPDWGGGRGGEGAFLPAPTESLGTSLLSTIVRRGQAVSQCSSARRLKDQDDPTPSLHGGGRGGGWRGGDQTVEWPELCPGVEQGTKKNTASQCLVLRT